MDFLSTLRLNYSDVKHMGEGFKGIIESGLVP